MKCNNQQCKNALTYHNDECEIMCKNYDCYMKNQYHKGKCLTRCKNSECELYYEFHKGKCNTKCSNKDCKIDSNIDDPYLNLCKNEKCLMGYQYHEGECNILCSNALCKYANEYHKGQCFIICQHPDSIWHWQNPYKKCNTSDSNYSQIENSDCIFECNLCKSIYDSPQLVKNEIPRQNCDSINNILMTPRNNPQEEQLNFSDDPFTTCLLFFISIMLFYPYMFYKTLCYFR